MIFKDNTKGLTGDIIEAKEIILDALNPSYSLPEGYYDSGTIIKIVPEELKVSPSVNTEEYVPTEGKVISSVVVNKVTGNATANDVLIGKTFNSEDGIGITGKMPMYNNIAVELSPDTPSYVIREGYYGDKCDISVNAKDLELTADADDIRYYESSQYFKEVVVHPTPSEVCNVKYSNSFGAQTYDPPAGKLFKQVSVPAVPTELYNATLDVNDFTYRHSDGKMISSVHVPGVPGTATASAVLQGYTFSSQNGINKGGTMKAMVGVTLDTATVTTDTDYTYFSIPMEGYYTTGSKIRALNSDVIKPLRFTLYNHIYTHGAGHDHTSNTSLTIDNSSGIYKKANFKSGDISVSVSGVGTLSSSNASLNLPKTNITFTTVKSGKSSTSGYSDYSSSSTATIELV